MTNHTEYIRTVKVSPDGRYVATGSTTILSKLLTFQIKLSFDNTDLVDVYDIDFSADGGTIAH